MSSESVDVASLLTDIADVEQRIGDPRAAERDYREALRVARAVNYAEAIAASTINLAELALHQKNWPKPRLWRAKHSLWLRKSDDKK